MFDSDLDLDGVYADLVIDCDTGGMHTTIKLQQTGGGPFCVRRTNEKFGSASERGAVTRSSSLSVEDDDPNNGHDFFIISIIIFITTIMIIRTK